MARLFPRSLREVVDKAARPIIKKRGFAEISVLRDWQVIVGDALAHQTQPLKIAFPRGETTGGTLTVACAPAFAPEIQQLAPMLMDKLATHIGYRAITRIIIEQHHTLALSRSTPAAKPEPQITETLSDDPLENALLRLEKIRNQKGDNTSKQQ